MSVVALVRDFVLPKVKDQEYVHRNANCTIRLYYNDVMVHSQNVTCWISRLDGRVYYGVGQAILMDDFHGTVNGATIALLGVPFESDISWGEEHIPRMHTLILRGNKYRGFLVLSGDKDNENSHSQKEMATRTSTNQPRKTHRNLRKSLRKLLS